VNYQSTLSFLRVLFYGSECALGLWINRANSEAKAVQRQRQRTGVSAPHEQIHSLGPGYCKVWLEDSELELPLML